MHTCRLGISLRSLVSCRVERSKRNSIPPRTHIYYTLFSELLFLSPIRLLNSWAEKVEKCVDDKAQHRAEVCGTSGIFTGAMALTLKDRDDKWHHTIKKNGRKRQRSPCF